ncbi:MAG: DUF1836 domain-containing protein [Clostridium sp.]|uniref:DUF1836 domain-containing protein n=1 Tax=Clostridium chrysemydis TaxID=2665504 RepID=UPI003EE70BCA
MNKNEILSYLDQLELDKNITLDEIPEIDLYMDQIIQLFENKFDSTKRNEDDKVLTKTMINNYAKGKLLIPIKNKKYSKEHLILISLIYNLKTGLSIGDIKEALNEIVEKNETEEEILLREVYKEYLKGSEEDLKELKSSLDKIINRINDSEKINEEYEKKLLLLLSMINMSNMYKRMSEKLIDEYFKK